MREKSIHILLPGSYQTIAELSQSNLASVRLRTAVAATFAQKSPISVSLGECAPTRSDLLLVGKIGANDIDRRTDSWLRDICALKSNGARILLDYTDNHIGTAGPMHRFYKSALALSDLIICPSVQMTKLIETRTKALITVIPDAIEVPTVPPCHKKPKRSVLWFGHSSNIPYLLRYIEKADFSTRDIRLTVLSNTTGLSIFRDHLPRTRVPLSVKLSEWSTDQMISEARNAELCIIPSDPKDPKKNGASSNRLITALALGLPTAASDLSSYREYADYFIDLDKIALDQIISNVTSQHNRVERAQRELIPKFQKETIGAQWANLLLSNLN
jgi:hypothetical protein